MPASDDPVRDRLLDAAREEFIDHGFRRTSVGDIAARAGVDRSTLFRRFGDKDAVVRAVVERDVVEFFTEYAATTTAAGRAEERTVEAFVVGMRACLAHPLVLAIKKFEPETLSGMLLTDDGFAAIRNVIAAGMVDETIAPDAAAQAAELIARLTATFLLARSSVLPLDTDEQTRAFAQRWFAPLITAARDNDR